MRWTSRSLLVVTVACAAAACASADGQVIPMPAELMGRWETEQGEYADRFFELSVGAIVIGTGGTTRQNHLISEVRRMADENGLLYAVTYRDADGTESTMRFYYDSSEGGRLRLKNQIRLYNQLGTVWRKVGR
jgi:hypothetical protein